MNLQKSRSRINELMSRFVAQVKGATAMVLTDINRVSEDVLIPLFSEIYGYTDLKNLNVSEGLNSPAIDLGDKKTRTAYQITSNCNAKKMRATLEKFVAHKWYEEYDRLIIYVLTDKQKSYQTGRIKEITQDKFQFDPKNDILDYRDLLQEISGFSSIEKSRKIENILEKHFGNDTQDGEPQDISDWLEQVEHRMELGIGNQTGLTMKIERKKLLDDLHNFASRGDGVIIGSPGVGKTYVLKALRQRLKSAGTTALLLRIDRLGDGTTKTLQEELSHKGDLIEKLQSIPISGKNAILMFDAFDAARDEQARKNFLDLIRRAIQELVKWNVVVTVRTYDAKKSQELLDLFGSPDDAEYQTKDILCRHFTIPPFSETEILQALDQIGCPESIYDDGSPDFRNLLSNPFNLWLLEKILKGSQAPLDFSQVHSEVQLVHSEVELLELFWQRRIENENSERVLHPIAHQMVKERSLSVRVRDIYDAVDLDKPERKTAWDKLQSDEILAKVSSTKQRIAFSHNILFDYAISVLLIEDEPKRIEEFILEDLARPLFLRPSLTYFFTRLWYHDRASFWKAFWHIFPSEQSVPLRLVARLIPTSVIANEAREIKQLNPLLEKLQNGEKIANAAITRLLQSLQTLQIKRDTPWIDFFDQVSLHVQDGFAWDLANLTSDILDRAIKTQNAEVINTCGKIGRQRQLLEWVWQMKKTSEDDWYNRFGGRWAVSLVAKTYGTNIDESRTLLKRVLELTLEDYFPIDFLSWLTRNIDKIWNHDPEFVISTYRTVFSHRFTSEGATKRGGPVLPIITYRGQDFGMCWHRLLKHFPDFLQVKPLRATQAAIQSLNVFIARKHTFLHSGETKAVDDLKETFNFRGKTAYFVEDKNYIWDLDLEKPFDKPIEMANILFEFIAELAKSEETILLLDSLLDVFCDEVEVAFFWKRLLKIGSQFPKVFAPRLFELCVAKPIQISLEAFYELGLFLKAAVPEFTPTQRLQIEENILALPKEAKDEDNSDFLEQRRDLFLGQIPANLLGTDEAKMIREKMERENSVPVNEPVFRFHALKEPYTEEKWLQKKGVDTTTPENQELRRFSEPFDTFSSEWRNGEPTHHAAALILPQLRKAYVTLKSDTQADKKVINLLWHHLTDCVAILARIANKLDRDSYIFCRQVLLEGAKHELPEPNPEYDAQFDGPGYSPFPRHEAAKGLPRLSLYQPDAEILDAIETLANDPVPSVRMVTAMNLVPVYSKEPERFWHILNSRAEREEHRVVKKYLYVTLKWVAARESENEDKTVNVMAKLFNHASLPQDRYELSDPFVDLLIWLAIDRENSWALDLIENTFYKDPSRFANILTDAVNRAMEDYVVLKDLETDEGRERVKRVIKFLSGAITVASNRIVELCSILEKQKSEETEKKLCALYEMIDAVITGLYFEVAHARDSSEESTEEVPYKLRCYFYNEVEPLMEQVIAFSEDKESGAMLARTAYYFMQVLTSFLSCNPVGVLRLAKRVGKAGERFGYNLESVAVRDIVEIVEIVLADYRHEVQEGEALEDLLELLDLFAKRGWTEALRLVWRLDEVFR